MITQHTKLMEASNTFKRRKFIVLNTNFKKINLCLKINFHLNALDKEKHPKLIKGKAIIRVTEEINQ